jgi:hypothetical protein
LSGDIFECVKDRVKVKEFAAYLGLEVNKAGFTHCVLHAEKTPSMKLYDNGFFCYGCNEGGDVVTLAAAYWGLRPYEAALQIAAAYGIPTGDKMTRSQIDELERGRAERQAERVLCEAFTGWCDATNDLLIAFTTADAGAVAFDPLFCAEFQALQARAAFLFEEFAAGTGCVDDIYFYKIYGAEIEELRGVYSEYERLLQRTGGAA